MGIVSSLILLGRYMFDVVLYKEEGNYLGLLASTQHKHPEISRLSRIVKCYVEQCLKGMLIYQRRRICLKN